MTDGKHSQGRMAAAWRRFRKDRRANVAVIFALALVPLCGVMSLAAEGSSWFLGNRAQQNAADSAVVAAANQGLQDYYASCASSCSWGTNYQTEGRAVTKQYGYAAGTGNITVTVTGPNSGTPVTCPSTVTIQVAGGASCFQVSVAKPYPLYLSRVLGFNGNSTVGGARMETITAKAIAGPVEEPSNICLLTLGWGANDGSQKYALQFHGSSGVNLEGCPVGTNGGMDCTGHTTLNAPFGVDGNDANGHNDKSSCGDFAYSQGASIADPYVSLDTSIPTNTCGSYPGQTGVSTGLGTTTAPQTIMVCGNLTLSANTAITGNEVIVIENGVLNLAGFNLSTSGTGGVAIIFTSPSTAQLPSSVTSGSVGYIQDSTGGGGIDISSNPFGSGTWSGVTVYQNPIPWNSCNCSALSGTDTTYNSTWDGNSSKTGWSLSGAYYLPNANLTLNGATDKASNGYNCFSMVLNSVDSNGGNNFSMFAHPLSECGQQGTVTPHVFGFRYALVG